MTETLATVLNEAEDRLYLKLELASDEEKRSGVEDVKSDLEKVKAHAASDEQNRNDRDVIDYITAAGEFISRYSSS